jgi:quinate dehydrogenase
MSTTQIITMPSGSEDSQPRRKGVLFGYPIAHSMSPLLHNTVFSALDMHWEFDFLESKDIQEFLPILKSSECYRK